MIENRAEAKAIRVTSDAIQVEPLVVAPIVALPMLLVLLIILLYREEKIRKLSNWVIGYVQNFL